MIYEEGGRFPPNISLEYSTLINELIIQKSNAETLKELKKVFTNFGKKYTPIAYLFFIWKRAAKWYKDEKDFSEIDSDISNLFTGYFDNTALNKIELLSQRIDILKLNHDSKTFYEFSFELEFNSYWSSLGDINYTDINIYQMQLERCKRLIQIPHKDMEYTFDKLILHSEYPLNVSLLKKYETANEVNQKILHYNSDDKNWIESLIESNDRECIERNIRYRISKHPFNKELWILYIKYLKNDANLQGMLKTYGRYCRLFFKDTVMLEKYRNWIEKAGENGECVTKFWIDTIQFERQFVSPESAGDILKRALKSYTIGPKGLIRYARRFFKKHLNCINLADIELGQKNLFQFNFQQHSTLPCSLHHSDDDDFSEALINLFVSKPFQTQIQGNLPNNLLLNIIKKSSISLLQKLFQTCKYYNIILRRLTCFYLSISDETKFGMFGQTLFLPASAVTNSMKFTAIFLRNALKIKSKNSKLLKSILPSFTSINLRSLQISSQNFTFKEYKILTKAGNIEDLAFYEVRVSDENRLLVPIELLISLIPKAYNIVIDTAMITENSGISLSKLNHLCKIKMLCIPSANQSLNIKDFCHFLTVSQQFRSHVSPAGILKLTEQYGIHCRPSAMVSVFVDQEDEIVREFKSALLETWKDVCKLNPSFDELMLLTESEHLDY